MHLIDDFNRFTWQINDLKGFLFLLAALIMLRGGNMRFRPATVFSFVLYLLNFSSNFVQMVTIES